MRRAKKNVFNPEVGFFIHYIVTAKSVMEKFVIEGGKKLYGNVSVSCAKNACLPLISASVLCRRVFLKSAPKIADLGVMCKLFDSLGGRCEFINGGIELKAENLLKYEPDEKMSKSIRASVFFLGSLLSRFKKAVVFKPGGCDIGSRPIDIHISGLKALGCGCKEFQNKYEFDGEDMCAGKVVLRYPSVGATINLIEAAVFLNGETVINNAAKEPEILCLCDFLNACGFKIFGGGTSEIRVTGVNEREIKSDVEFFPIKDRIEAGTFMCACAACGGEVVLQSERNGVLQTVNFLRRAGGEIYEKPLKGGLYEFAVRFKTSAKNASVKADVFPAFATDMQPLALAAVLKARGKSVIADGVYKKRFGYARELKKFGADISVDESDGFAVVSGVENLHGATGIAGDLRGGAALVLAGLSADGKSEILCADKIRRGYEYFDEKLRLLGADVKHVF